jgi:iron complex outermembrane receptor protein
MKRMISLAFAGASALAIASAADAQNAPAPPPAAAAPAQGATLGEIVVTARRRSESLQEVPQTVNAVTADTLQKLNIRQFQDIQSVVPGLSLQPTPTGFQNAASLRGVSFDVNTGAQPTVAFYLNDAPVQLSFLFQSMFDIGQVEVLKGPQGTNRGISAPSGAMTITTHKPDLSDYGGYVDVTATDQHGRNAQGAFNIPIVKDVLALRIAALHDENNINGVGSIHNNLRPSGKTDAVRTSLSFEPSDAFNANIVYQHLDNTLIDYVQVTGPGQGAFTIGDTFFPSSVNPPLSVDQRAAVQDMPNRTTTNENVVVANVDSRIFGQHLSYVGSYTFFKVHAVQESGHPSAGDVGNLLPGVAIFQDVHSQQVETTHEFRIASDPAPGRFFDYTAGAFYHWVNPTSNNGGIVNPGPLLPGAFGNSPTPDLAAFNPAFQVPVIINVPSTTQEVSLFGSITFHLGENTELTGGIRHIWSVVHNNTTISTENGLLSLGALGLPPGVPCSLLGFASGSLPGSCVLNTAQVVSNLHNYESDTPNIYNVSLSHHFTRNFLVYANTGTSFRPAVASVGIQGQLANFTLPGGNSLSFHPGERSRAYEVGFKSTWLDDRLRLNVSLFRQHFHNLTIYLPHIFYNDVVPGLTPSATAEGAAPGTYVPTIFDFTATVDALVQGFDVDTAFQVTPNWNVSAQMSYASGQTQGSQVPCNIGPSGAPVFNTGALISLCPGASSSRLPLWSMTLQSEYTHPVIEGQMDGFIRALASVYPENKYAEPHYAVPNYALVNFYAGIRSHDGAWEASVFVRNALNKAVATDISPAEANLSQSLAQAFPQLNRPSGYFETLTTPPREVGINIHYSWGSR